MKQHKLFAVFKNRVQIQYAEFISFSQTLRISIINLLNILFPLLQVQFVVAFVHAMVPFFYDCGYQKGFAYAVMGHALLFMVMFMNFYRHTYNKKRNELEPGVKSESSALKSNGTTSYGKFDKYGNLTKRNNGMIIQEEAAKRKVSGKDL